MKEDVAFYFDKLDSPLPMDVLYQLLLELVWWFRRRNWKCKMFTDWQTDRKTYRQTGTGQIVIRSDLKTCKKSQLFKNEYFIMHQIHLESFVGRAILPPCFAFFTECCNHFCRMLTAFQSQEENTMHTSFKHVMQNCVPFCCRVNIKQTICKNKSQISLTLCSKLPQFIMVWWLVVASTLPLGTLHYVIFPAAI